MFAKIPERVDFLSNRAIHAAIKVHKELGPGLIESVYETCLFYELNKLEIECIRQVRLPIKYDGVLLDANLTGGSAQSATTGADGSYAFSGLTGGVGYMVTPSGLGMTYEATSRSYPNLTSNIFNADFMAFTAAQMERVAFTVGSGALNGNAAANRTAKSSPIPGLSIANGASFWIRWNDFAASNADDGLGVDDFSMMPANSGAANPAIGATKVDSIFTDTDADGQADPGEVLLYTVTIGNGGSQATGVRFEDIINDPNLWEVLFSTVTRRLRQLILR